VLLCEQLDAATRTVLSSLTRPNTNPHSKLTVTMSDN